MSIQDFKYYNDLIHEKYAMLPIIITNETAACLNGFVSVNGKIQYYGDKKYENDDLVWIPQPEIPLTYTNHLFKLTDLKCLDNVSTIVSLIIHRKSQYGLKGLCRAIRRLSPDVRWWDIILKYELEKQLYECLETAVYLKEDDKTIFYVVQERFKQ